MGENLKGKVAVVTGSGQGIGRSIAIAMGAEGAKVVVRSIGESGQRGPLPLAPFCRGTVGGIVAPLSEPVVGSIFGGAEAQQLHRRVTPRIRARVVETAQERTSHGLR